MRMGEREINMLVSINSHAVFVGRKKLTSGVIAGIVIAILAAITIVIVIVSFSTCWLLLYLFSLSLLLFASSLLL